MLCKSLQMSITSGVRATALLDRPSAVSTALICYTLLDDSCDRRCFTASLPACKTKTCQLQRLLVLLHIDQDYRKASAGFQGLFNHFLHGRLTWWGQIYINSSSLYMGTCGRQMHDEPGAIPHIKEGLMVLGFIWRSAAAVYCEGYLWTFSASLRFLSLFTLRFEQVWNCWIDLLFFFSQLVNVLFSCLHACLSVCLLRIPMLMLYIWSVSLYFDYFAF